MQHTDIFENRRSINFFDKARPLPGGLLKQIIDLAVLAPSAFNLQPWRLIAVESEEAKARLLPLAFNQPKVSEAPVTLILVGNYEGWDVSNPVWKAMVAMMGEEGVKGAQGMARGLYGETPERKMKFAESNTGLLAMSIMHAAQVYGVETHPMSGVDFDSIKAEFGLSDSEEVVMLLAMGYLAPDKELYPRAKRLGYDDMVTTI